jgi:hypothetical protein
MSTTKTTINLPKSIGGNNLIDSFDKINLSAELKDFLAALNARLTVSFSSGSGKPEYEILDKKGNSVCSINEFVKLGGYRRWVNDELKALEKELASDEKVKLIALFFRRAASDGEALSERIEEANETKFRQFHSMIVIVNQHLEVIQNTITSDIRDYLKRKGKMLITMLYKLMLECIKPKKLEKELLDEQLIEHMIPKWLFNKFVDKNFTNNLRADARSLLFPKGNYLKSISLTQTELLNEKFLAGNEEIVAKSGAIIALAKQDWSVLYGSIPKELEQDVKKFLDNMTWTLNSPYEVKDILEIRAGGKTPPTFRARQKPNPRPSARARPETEAQRVCREIYNTIGAMNAAFLHMQNLIIPVANPLEEFWSLIIPGTDEWEITPTHGLYEHVKESNKDLSLIKDLSNDRLLALMAEVMCQAAKVSTNSKAGLQILQTIRATKDRSTYVEREKPYIIDTAKSVDITSLKRVELDEDIIEKTKKFLGISSKTTKKKKFKSGASAIRLHTSVLNELEAIKSSPIYERAREWISSSFKTGNRTATQLLAAQYMVGEVLKYQDELLEEDFDEFRTLEELEEYEEED